MKKSKNYRSSIEKITEEIYSIEEAIKLVKEVSTEKFDASVQLSFNLNVDPRHADQQLRGNLVLPNGNGKTPKILVVVNEENRDKAKKATYVGGIEQLEKIKKENWFDFDFIITTPDLMSKFATYGKLLGPKGLMPNPKLGTVTENIEEAIENILKGQIEYRTDKEGNINLLIGKKSFTDGQLIANYDLIFKTLVSKRPATVKGDFISSITVSSTMSPGIKVKYSK